MKTGTVQIYRLWQDNKQTSGICNIFDANLFPLFTALSLERGWRDNKPNVSCLPMGNYPLILEYSNAFKTDLWEIKDTEPRSECKFHSAAYWYHLEGCIALGRKHKKINNDNYYDVTDSRNTMKDFHSVLSQFDKVELEISGLTWLY